MIYLITIAKDLIGIRKQDIWIQKITDQWKYLSLLVLIINARQNTSIIKADDYRKQTLKAYTYGKKNIKSIRDGPLENLLGGGTGEVQKKYSRKEKLNEKKIMHAN